MKKLICLTTLLCIFPLSHCTSPGMPDNTDTTTETPAAAPAEMTDAELETLAGNYVNTLKAINGELEPSNIHGSRVKTFLDPEAFEAYESKSFPYANDTVSIKESHNSPTGPIGRLYVMKKIEGYDPGNGDWFYGVMSPEGVASQKGKIQFCINCHKGAQDKDYIFGFE